MSIEVNAFNQKNFIISQFKSVFILFSLLKLLNFNRVLSRVLLLVWLKEISFQVIWMQSCTKTPTLLTCCSHKPGASVPCLGRSNKTGTWKVSVFFYFSYIEMLASRRHESCCKEHLFLRLFFPNLLMPSLCGDTLNSKHLV